VHLANAIKQSMHLEGLPIVVVPHPLGDQVVASEKATLVAADIVNAVIQPNSRPR
jgi:hypothetical protein